MNRLMTNSNSSVTRSVFVALLVVTLVAGTSIWGTFEAWANHPVLVEGELDFDGDGLVGLAEDSDNPTDRVFGTLTAALGAANGGANQNGRVTIVTSGRFHEQVSITNANGNVTLEAAPGVEANIDAVGTGARAAEFPSSDNATRQGQPGILVNSPANRYATLRNLVIRNWTDGILVLGSSRVTIDHCRIEGNVDYGIYVPENGRVTITNSHINSTGHRVGATGDFPGQNQPNPGIGILFTGTSSGTIVSTTVSGSFNAGIGNTTGNPSAVRLLDVNAFDNNPDFAGINPPECSVPGASKR